MTYVYLQQKQQQVVPTTFADEIHPRQWYERFLVPRFCFPNTAGQQNLEVSTLNPAQESVQYAKINKVNKNDLEANTTSSYDLHLSQQQVAQLEVSEEVPVESTEPTVANSYSIAKPKVRYEIEVKTRIPKDPKAPHEHKGLGGFKVFSSFYKGENK